MTGMLRTPWAPRGLLAPPITTPGTGAVSADTVIGTIARSVGLLRWYRVEWITFDANTTVANDRFTFSALVGATSLQTVTMTFPSTTVAATPVPPIFGWWQADTTGVVTFSIHVVRAVGTGTINVNGGTMAVCDFGLGT